MIKILSVKNIFENIVKNNIDNTIFYLDRSSSRPANGPVDADATSPAPFPHNDYVQTVHCATTDGGCSQPPTDGDASDTRRIPHVDNGTTVPDCASSNLECANP